MVALLIENAGGVSTAPVGSFIGPNGMAEAPDGSVWMAQMAIAGSSASSLTAR